MFDFVTLREGVTGISFGFLGRDTASPKNEWDLRLLGLEKRFPMKLKLLSHFSLTLACSVAMRNFCDDR